MEELSISLTHDSLDDKPGISKPIKITASNHKDYILKNHVVEGNGSRYDFDASFAQELLVSKIAKILNVPTPETVVIRITDEDLNQFSKLRFDGRFVPGLYFGVEYIPDSLNEETNVLRMGMNQGQPFMVREWNNIFKKISNPDAIPKIFALDFLTMNSDRYTNPGNILISAETSGKNLISIDYGHCFYSPYWRDPKNKMPAIKTAQLLENDIDINNQDAIRNCINLIHQHFVTWSNQHHQQNLRYGVVFTALDGVMNDSSGNPFAQVVSDIEGLSVDNIEDVINDVPDSWFVDGSMEKQAYLGFLARQIPLLRPLLNFQANMGLYSNVKRGDLEWQQGKSTNIG